MYLPKQFHDTDPAIAQRIMREHPLASVVSVGEDGFPVLSHIPLHWQAVSYMSPGVYADKQRVPTWSYLAVQAKGQTRIVDPHTDRDRLLKCLIADHEPSYAQQWRELSATYTTAMLNGIVAFEMVIVELQCAVKLNQHRPEAHAAMHAAYAAGPANAQALARWMQDIGLVPSAQG